MGRFDEHANRIQSLDRLELEARLRDAARGLFPERLIDDLEVRHLIRVLTECPGGSGEPCGTLRHGGRPRARTGRRICCRRKRLGEP